MPHARLAIYSTLRFHPWGAPDVLWARVALAALKRGHAVIAVVRPQIFSHPEITALRAAGAQIHLVPEIGGRGKLSRLAGMARNFRSGAHRTLAALRRFQPTFVLVNQGGFYDFVFEDGLVELVSQGGIPYAILAHSNQDGPPFDRATRQRAVQLIHGARTFFAVSQFILELAERQLLTRIENAALFQNPLTLPENLPLPWPQTGTPAFAVVARLDAYGKGLDILLPALRESPGLQQDWHLNVYGAGPDEDYLRDLAQWTGLERRITFHGHVADKATIWQNNHLLLLPSRWEGAPVVVIEAMLCGRPVLRTHSGGVAEWMRDGVNGFVCPAAEQNLLAQTLATAWSRRHEWREMGVAAHAHASAIVDPDPEAKLLALLDA